MNSEFDAAEQVRLRKTVSHLFSETSGLLQAAIDKASEARSAGSGRSRGYASLTVVVVGLIFQSGGLFAIDKLKPEPPSTTLTRQIATFSDAERRLVKTNLDRIAANTSQISAMKSRMAPSMPIEANVAAINASAQDIETVVLNAVAGKDAGGTTGVGVAP